MTKHMSVEIDEQMDAFIGEQISHGNYDSPSEVIDAALKLPRSRAKIRRLRRRLPRAMPQASRRSLTVKRF